MPLESGEVATGERRDGEVSEQMAGQDSRGTQGGARSLRHWGTSRGLGYEDKQPCWRKSYLVTHHNMAQDYSATQPFENHKAMVYDLPQH